MQRAITEDIGWSEDMVNMCGCPHNIQACEERFVLTVIVGLGKTQKDE